MNSYPTTAPANAGARATIYTTLGQTLRVPLSAGGAPESQLISWFNRQAAANPGFPLRVRSILLLSGAGGSEAGVQALRRFLQRWQLAGRLRVVGPNEAGLRGEYGSSGAAETHLDELLRQPEHAAAGPRGPAADQELGELLQEYEGLFARFRRWFGQNPGKAAVIKGAMDATNPLPANVAALADHSQDLTEVRQQDNTRRQSIDQILRNRPAAAGSPPAASRLARPATNWAAPRTALGRPTAAAPRPTPKR